MQILKLFLNIKITTTVFNRLLNFDIFNIYLKLMQLLDEKVNML